MSFTNKKVLLRETAKGILSAAQPVLGGGGFPSPGGYPSSDLARGVLQSCPGWGYDRTGTPSQDWGTPGKDMGPEAGVPSRKDMGPVAGVPPPLERTWDQTPGKEPGLVFPRV